MEAKDYFEEKKPNMRELWNLSDAQKKMMYILMEEYAALCQPLVVGRSEQLCDHPEAVVRDTVHYRHCMKCGKKF